ncbi:MAG: hypothetical protein CMJ49_10900 [Planctomycetaceae bacterium]|nr:hypothetical protein [Planctomycetaceae bacterium]
MPSILITGTSGFLGTALARRLAADHEVIGLSRQPVDVATHNRTGAFHAFEDLRALDEFNIDTAIHLAATVGGCSEEDAIAVNVAGTRRLMRYLLDRGVRKFVMASSICAYGGLTTHNPPFIPRQLPMRPTDRYLGHDAYGLSKWLMEELVRDFSRACADADFANVRIGAVFDERDAFPSPPTIDEIPTWAFVALGRVALTDVIDGLTTFATAPHRPGERTVNLVGPDIAAHDPTVVTVQAFLKKCDADLDLSYYQQPGREYASLYSMDETQRDFGFVPRISVRPKQHEPVDR